MQLDLIYYKNFNRVQANMSVQYMLAIVISMISELNTLGLEDFYWGNCQYKIFTYYTPIKMSPSSSG